MQLKVRRHSQPKHHRAKQALIAVGAIGLAAGTVRRLRHRQHNAEGGEQ